MAITDLETIEKAKMSSVTSLNLSLYFYSYTATNILVTTHSTFSKLTEESGVCPSTAAPHINLSRWGRQSADFAISQRPWKELAPGGSRKPPLSDFCLFFNVILFPSAHDNGL